MVFKMISNPRPRPCNGLQGRKRLGGSLPRPKICIYYELNPNLRFITTEGIFLFTTTQSYTKIARLPRLAAITLRHLPSISETGLSSAKARPTRTSYCALLNVIYFTIYFMKTNEPLLQRIASAFPPTVADGPRYRHTYTHIGRIGVPLLSRQKSLGEKVATVQLSRNRLGVTD